MTSIAITKDEDGRIRGFTEKDQAAFAKLQKRQRDLEPGELMWIDTWFERSGVYHRRHMAVLKAFYDAQEQFNDFNEFRQWTQVGAGHCDFFPGPHGRMVAVPKSISYRKIDQAEIEQLHGKTVDFLRSTRGRQFLWPHLSEEQTYETVETLMGEFEGNGG